RAAAAGGKVVLQPGSSDTILFQFSTVTAKLSFNRDDYKHRFYYNTHNEKESLSISNTAICIETPFFKFPVKDTGGHPMYYQMQDGYMYVNKNDKTVYMYIDGMWRSLYSWI
ncbi:MAG: hypothetical protein LBB56_05125, partial [Chitinispirillales bacterium]|nr:hypothetical protein [Chitinispirillales bacterium]